jgi:ribonuclease HI
VEHWADGAWVRRDYWISEPATTNNRMAIRSAIEGLSALKRSCRVIFTSDSQYLVKGMSEWIEGWVRRGLAAANRPGRERRPVAAATSRGSPPRGRVALDPRPCGHPQNEYANDLAVRAARQQDHSAGLVESGFLEWLEDQRTRHERYLDFFEFQPPG